ncbi:MAG: hypothetical protein AAFX79_02300 [Planctomycetota bacterium]
MHGQLTLRISALAGTLAVAGSALAQYDIGDSWHRQTDWAPGTLPGTTAGNPSPGFDGIPVWSHEAVAGGGGLDADTPWYAQPSTQLSWDTNWWTTGQSGWTNGEDVNPPIFQDRMVHHAANQGFNDVPLVRWLVPGTEDIAVDIDGTLSVLWTGEDFIGTDRDVELVVARDNGDGTIDVLFSDRVNKPNPLDTVGDTMDSNVDLNTVLLDSDDSIIISGRAVDSTGRRGHWMAISDDLTIEVVPIPAPASIALLGLGGLAALRRTRR